MPEEEGFLGVPSKTDLENRMLNSRMKRRIRIETRNTRTEKRPREGEPLRRCIITIENKHMISGGESGFSNGFVSVNRRFKYVLNFSVDFPTKKILFSPLKSFRYIGLARVYKAVIPW